MFQHISFLILVTIISNTLYSADALPADERLDCSAVFCESQSPTDCQTGETFIPTNVMHGICCDVCVNMQEVSAVYLKL